MKRNEAFPQRGFESPETKNERTKEVVQRVIDESTSLPNLTDREREVLAGELARRYTAGDISIFESVAQELVDIPGMLIKNRRNARTKIDMDDAGKKRRGRPPRWLVEQRRLEQLQLEGN